MIHYKKKINLEPYISRTPSIVNSVIDNTGRIITFSYYDLIENDNKDGAGVHNRYSFENNYDTLPSDIYIDDTPLKNAKNGGNIASYYELTQWYHFMYEYRTLVRSKYDSVVDYNFFEGEDMDVNSDEKYEKLGGDEGYKWLIDKVFLMFQIPQELVDEWHVETLHFTDVKRWLSWFSVRYDLYKDNVICDNVDNCCDCEKYQKLGGDEMFLRLKDWLYSLDIDNNIEHVQTSAITANRHESFVYLATEDYYKYNTETQKQDKILSAGDIWYYDYVKSLPIVIPEKEYERIKVTDFSAFIEIPILFVNEIDDIGEMSVLAENWVNLVDYNECKINEESKLKGGDVVFYNDSDWLLLPTNESDTDHVKGFYYSDKFKEGYFASKEGMTEDEYFYFLENSEDTLEHFRTYNSSDTNDDHWGRYFYHYVNENRKEFNRHGSMTYSFKNGVLIEDPTPFKMADVYMINYSELGYFLIEGTIYEVFYADYIIYKGVYYLVRYEDDENKTTPYVIYRGKKIYAYSSENVNDLNNNVWYFNFNKIPCKNDGDKVAIMTDRFVMINNGLRTVTSNYLFYCGVSYKLFNFYCDYNGIKIPFELESLYDSLFLIPKKSVLEDVTGLVEHFEDCFSYFKAERLSSIKEMTSTSEEVSKVYGVTTFIGDGDAWLLHVYSPYKIYNTNFVTGETESRLSEFIGLNRVSCDDLGNELPGTFVTIKHTFINDTLLNKEGLIGNDIFKNADEYNNFIYEASKFSQPKMGDMLEMLYEPGMVKHLIPITFSSRDSNLTSCIVSTDEANNDEADNSENFQFKEAETNLSEQDLDKIFSNDYENVPSVGEGEETIDVNTTKEYYWGDILSSMEFFYEDSKGRRVISIRMDTNNYVFENGAIKYDIYIIFNFGFPQEPILLSDYLTKNGVKTNTKSRIDIIQYLIEIRESLVVKEGESYPNFNEEGELEEEDAIIFDIKDQIYCEFEYYKGAIITREYKPLDISIDLDDVSNNLNDDDKKKFQDNKNIYENILSEIDSLYSYGPFKVSYLDDGVKFDDIKNLSLFDRVKRSRSGETKHHNYGVRYTEVCEVNLKHKNYYLDELNAYNVYYYEVKQNAKSVDYKGNAITKNMAQFTTSITSYEDNFNDFYEDELFVDDNGFISSPVTREEYRFGISQIDRVQGKVKIDRGVAQSMEKHFKLLSCKSFEALEKYGNGYYKIMDENKEK